MHQSTLAGNVGKQSIFSLVPDTPGGCASMANAECEARGFQRLNPEFCLCFGAAFLLSNTVT